MAIRKIGFILFCGTLMLLACENNINEVNALTSSYNASKDIGENILVTYSDSGVVKVQLKSPLLERYTDPIDPKDVFPKGITITFYDQFLHPTSWLTADEATRSYKARKMTAKGHVKFYNTKNEKLESSELIWDEGRKLIYTDKFIKITRPLDGDTIYGVGFQADQDFKRIEIKKRMQGKLNVEGLSEGINRQ